LPDYPSDSCRKYAAYDYFKKLKEYLKKLGINSHYFFSNKLRLIQDIEDKDENV
jgi:hypothetical protein